MQHCLLFMRILKISCKAAIKSFFKISVHKYYVVGIKTVVVVIVAIFAILLPFCVGYFLCMLSVRYSPDKSLELNKNMRSTVEVKKLKLILERQ